MSEVNKDSNNSCKSESIELLEWELSLDSRDLRSHPWYHGNISRFTAESLLFNDGDFLVRDCTSSGRTGDFVLTCQWDSKNLHFLVHRDVVQADTIYEKLSFRFENERFDTVSDLITFHVGSGIPISSISGALIHSPRIRKHPIGSWDGFKFGGDVRCLRGDYVSLDDTALQRIPVGVHSKVMKTEKFKHHSLNLNPPSGLLEELENIPDEIKPRLKLIQNESDKKTSSYDLSSFHSLLIPTCGEIRMNSEVLEIVRRRLLETSNRSITLHLTKLDWMILNGFEDGGGLDGLYDLISTNSEFRWNHVIERSFTLSHFVFLTILTAEIPELMLSKWIGIAIELKTSLGNFYGFCSIMRALLMPQLTGKDGPINWMKLRQEYTQSTFHFETGLRLSFQNLVRGIESYPPNTTIPELLPIALILEDSLKILSVPGVGNGDDCQLEVITTHLKDFRALTTWKDLQERNLDRQLSAASGVIEWDEILTDIFRTEFQLLILWGVYDYANLSLEMRCESLDQLIKNSFH